MGPGRLQSVVWQSQTRLRPGFDPWLGKIPWRRKQQPTPALLPGKSPGWRSLVGYSPWGRKELDTTKQLHFHFCNSTRMPKLDKRALTAPSLPAWLDLTPASSLTWEFLQLGRVREGLGCQPGVSGDHGNPAGPYGAGGHKSPFP